LQNPGVIKKHYGILGFTLRKVSFHMAAKPISAKGMRWLRSLTFQTQDIVIMGYINGIGQIFTTYSRPLLKRSGAFFAGSYLAMAFATGTGASESSIEFQAIGKRFIGTWSSSGTYSTDYPGVGKREISSEVNPLVDGLQVVRLSCAKVMQEIPERGMLCNSFIGTLP
jgi:hypothetical protein